MQVSIIYASTSYTLLLTCKLYTSLAFFRSPGCIYVIHLFAAHTISRTKNNLIDEL